MSKTTKFKYWNWKKLKIKIIESSKNCKLRLENLQLKLSIKFYQVLKQTQKRDENSMWKIFWTFDIVYYFNLLAFFGRNIIISFIIYKIVFILHTSM